MDLQENIKALGDLWKETFGDPDIRIAILDGPIELSHPSLSTAHLKYVVDAQKNINSNGSALRHGTHITSIIFGQHDSEVKGLSPSCSGILIPIFFDDANNSIIPCSQSGLAKGIDRAIDEGAHIINISAGQPSPLGVATRELKNAVRRCVNEGVLIVAAAGNGGCVGFDVCSCLHVPGALPSVLPVGSMDEKGEPLEYSNCGESYQKHGILAPGENILGAVPGGGVISMSGTSSAAAVVTGVIGLLTSLMKKMGRPIDPFIARDAILISALGCEHQSVLDCRQLLAGRLNLQGAINIIKRGENRMSNELPVKSAAALSTASKNDTEQLQFDSSIPSVDSSLILNGQQQRELEKHKSPTSSLTLQSQVREEMSAKSIQPAGCSCGGNEAGAKQLVFAIGQLGYDFGTESRRNSLQGSMERSKINGHPSISSPTIFLRHLQGWKETYFSEKDPKKVEHLDHDGHLYDAKSVIWTLLQDGIPQYAIQPQGAFAEQSYAELVRFLMEQVGFDTNELKKPQPENNPLNDNNTIAHLPLTPRTQFVAIPGEIIGQTRLLTGHVLPVIQPDMRGTAEWSTFAFENEIIKKLKLVDNEASELVRRVIDRFSDEIRNPGLSPEDRVINHGATNVFPIIINIFDRVKNQYKLEQIEIDDVFVSESKVISPGSYDLYDFNLSLFDPFNTTRARVIISLTVDVGDVVPSTVGSVRISSRR